jgi:FkbM family methyltransferase
VDREFELLQYLVPRDKLAIDVGANTGLYTEALLKLTNEVIAIDPNPENTDELKRLFGNQAQIIVAAAGSVAGTSELRLPKDRLKRGLATIDKHNQLAGVATTKMDVKLITLDSLDIENVGFIKIDVEGHEVEVLLGARHLLESSHPVLLIEAEDRHRMGAVQSLRDFLEPLGYEGYFFLNCVLISIRTFDTDVHQDRSPNSTATKPYVYNFIFLPTC